MTAKIAAFGAMLQRRLSRDGTPDDNSSIQRRFSMSSATSAPTMNDEYSYDVGSKSAVDHYAGKQVCFKLQPAR